ncbi:MAG: hypothetical protein HY081_03650 [Gammaproteobacteria bacterium]|nr:hypothetical protein [Gammaproteobacteria bacterium]
MHSKSQKMTKEWPLSQKIILRRRSLMLKLGGLIGMSSVISYLASAHSQLLDNILYIFVLSAAALVLAIMSQIGAKKKSSKNLY